MKRSLIAVSLVVLTACGSAALLAGPEKDKGKPGDAAAAGMPSEAEMAAWMAAGMPGAGHEAIKQCDGNWQGECKFWMAPGAPPETSKGTMKAKWILDGRWLQQDWSGTMDMPGPDGKVVTMGFTGMGLFGYDNVTKKYIGTWADSMSTCMMQLTGDYDAAKKTWTMRGELKDPMGQLRKMREVVRVESPDRMVMEMHESIDGKPEYMSMQIVYTKMK